MAAEDRQKPAASPPFHDATATRPSEPVPPDPYAQQSFTFRRMKRWQIVALLIVLTALILAIIVAWA